LHAQTLVQVLKQCGDTLTRENVMKQAANLKNLQLGMLLPGIMINTSPSDFARADIRKCGSMFAIVAAPINAGPRCPSPLRRRAR
jgi:hypothetical protein